MGLKDWLRKLEEAADADTVTIVCLECGEEFRVHEDTSVAYLVSEWTKATGEKGYWAAPPDLLRLEAHAHTLFIDKADGSPWLGDFFYGIHMQEDIEDLSEP